MQSENRKRTKLVGVRTLPAEKEVLAKAAADAGEKLPEFMRVAALARAENNQQMIGTKALEATMAVLAKHSPLFESEEYGWYCFDGEYGHAQFESLEEWRAHVAPYLVAAIKNLNVDIMDLLLAPLDDPDQAQKV